MHNKHYMLLLAAFTYVTTTFAQFRIKDQGTIGGSKDDGFASMYLTRDKGLIVGGYSFSNISAQKTQNSRGVSDYWVVKLDSNHKIEWDKTIGGSLDDDLYAVQQTTDDGYILGGASSSGKSGEKTGINKGGTDYWIVKLNKAGNIQWDKTFGGNIHDVFSVLQQTADGGYILGGSSFSQASGDKTQNTTTGADDYDYWIVKVDALGNKQWDKTIGSNGHDYLYALQQTTDGGYILGGWSYNSTISGQKTENGRGGYDYWVVKTDATGNVQWDKTIGGGGGDNLLSLQQTTDGGYILGGYSASNISGEKTGNSKGGNDYWLVKLNSNGTIQWDKTIGGNRYDVLYSLQQTEDGGYILAGNSQSGISGDKTSINKGDYDYWIVKVDNSGNVQWNRTLGGSLTEGGYIVVKEIKKNDYVIGGTSKSGISGDKTGGNRDKTLFTNDYWIVELQYKGSDSVAITQLPIARTAAPKQSSNAFSIYPNPATTVLHIQNSGKATFILSDQGGKRMLTKILEGNGDLNIANIPAGTYYLTNTTTGTTQKVVITK